MRSINEQVKKSLRKTCSSKNLKRKFPIISWLPKYRLETLLQDAIAGISVGLTAVPQGIAYAGIAGLELQYGLYSCFMGCFVYLIFGSCKDITMGPTAILSLMTKKYSSGYGTDFVLLLTFLSGCLVFLMGLLNLGFLIDFISAPVTTGFTTAAAITICFTQLPFLLGYKGTPATFLDAVINLVDQIHDVSLWDSVIGILTIIALLLTKELGKFGSRTTPKDTPWGKSLLLRVNWFISVARNALVIVVTCLVAWIFSKYDLEPFTLTGPIEGGLPPFQLPPFSTVQNNVTYNFIEMAVVLGPSIITIAFIAILEAVAIARAFSTGKMLDSTQEFTALGLCNIFGSFVGSMPTTSSFSRCVINNSAGVQTTAGGIFTGTLVLLALNYLTSTFQYIPKPVLAGIVITAVLFMVELKVVYLYWKSRKLELLPYGTTVLACLFLGLNYGMLVGICVNALIVMAKTARPTIDLEVTKINDYDVLLITPSDDLLYCSADHFSKKVMKVAFTKDRINNKLFVIIIDGHKVKQLDITVAKNIKNLIESTKARGHNIFLWRFSSKVEKVLLGIYPDSVKKFTHQEDVTDIIKLLQAHMKYSNDEEN